MGDGKVANTRLLLHTKLFRLQVDCSMYVLYVIEYVINVTADVTAGGTAGSRKHLTAEHHTTQLALPDLVFTQKNICSKNRNDEVNQGRSG